MTGSRATEFPIRLQRNLRPILLLFGVWSKSRAWVRLEPDHVVARFGFSNASVPLANVERWDITGPYRWWTAAGIRGTPGKPEITYGGSMHGGLCLRLREKQRIGWARIEDFYVTVDNLEGFGAALAARGIPGEDLRRTR